MPKRARASPGCNCNCRCRECGAVGRGGVRRCWGCRRCTCRCRRVRSLCLHVCMGAREMLADSVATRSVKKKKKLQQYKHKHKKSIISVHRRAADNASI